MNLIPIIRSDTIRACKCPTCQKIKLITCQEIKLIKESLLRGESTYANNYKLVDSSYFEESKN